MSENDVGNVAVLRKALEFASTVLAKWRPDAPFRAWNEYGEAIDKCRAALDAPPRNCDVGTCKEQAIRKEAYCQRYSPLPTDNCDSCPLRGYNRPSPEHMVGYSCDLAWAQMPYDAAMPNYTRMQEAFNRYRNNPSLHMDCMKENEVFKPFRNLHEALKADPNDPRWDEVCQDKPAPESAKGDIE